jgi:hypothetical protein
MCDKFFHIDYILSFNDVHGSAYKLKIRRKKMVFIPPIGMIITFGKFTAIIKSISAPVSFDVITCNLIMSSQCSLDDIIEMRKMGWVVEETTRSDGG